MACGLAVLCYLNSRWTLAVRVSSWVYSAKSQIFDTIYGSSGILEHYELVVLLASANSPTRRSLSRECTHETTKQNFFFFFTFGEYFFFTSGETSNFGKFQVSASLRL